MDCWQTKFGSRRKNIRCLACPLHQRIVFCSAGQQRTCSDARSKYRLGAFKCNTPMRSGSLRDQRSLLP